MDEPIAKALAADRVVDITTVGKKTGLPRRKEVWLWTVADGYALAGWHEPALPRDWYANLLAHPDFTVHVKRGAQADLPAHATPVTDTNERRRLLTDIARQGDLKEDIEERVAKSPLLRVEFL